jgi:RNA methyltransferase, TrmH family
VAEPKAITSRDNPLLVRLRKLVADPAAYRKQHEAWLEGEHLCEVWLQRGGVVPQALISEAGWEDARLRALARRAAAVAVLPDALMKTVSTLDSAAPLAFAVPWAATAQPDGRLASVVLDRVQDAGNVGTLLRSASAFGFTQVLALKGTAALWSPKVLRAGMGAHFGLTLVEGLGEDALAALAANGLPLLATSPHATQAIDAVRLPWPCAWVFGHEGQGISATLQARCALDLRIPQPGGEESLNVAAAAAVCLYESARQRR